LDLEELRKLCALLREEDLTELTVEEEGRRITIRRAPVPGVPPPSQGKAGEAELVRSPVVGTFWRRPAPGEDPFAMKVMNEVRADRAGLIEEVLVEEGQPVEYGQPLFRLRPT